MTRVQILLAALAAILVIVLFWMLLWSPKDDELEELRAETEQIELQQTQTATRIAELEAVRDEAPEKEAVLAAARAVLPHDPGLPAFLRQVQLAADESGLTLQAISPVRPEPVTIEGAEAGLHRINLTVDLEGGYFQIVDFLRRIEDPSITPRGLTWNALDVTGDPAEHPTLEASLQGDLFALLPVTPSESEAPPPGQQEEPQDGETDEDVDVDVEVEDAA